MADNNKQKLFSDFTAPSRQEWLDKIQVDLKTSRKRWYGGPMKDFPCNPSI